MYEFIYLHKTYEKNYFWLFLLVKILLRLSFVTIISEFLMTRYNLYISCIYKCCPFYYKYEL